MGQTRTLRALRVIDRRLKELGRRGTIRQLHEEESYELTTLLWVKHLLRSDEDWTDQPEGFR
jgi:hypothetical protein